MNVNGSNLSKAKIQKKEKKNLYKSYVYNSKKKKKNSYICMPLANKDDILILIIPW